eukprot:GILK01006845.1.p1 GENE.GILK01006845.1~~GILK01006845.1.p1  ORF type:complete len:454 (-),score=49.21 GILK01006845.1:188-1495(-)
MEASSPDVSEGSSQFVCRVASCNKEFRTRYCLKRHMLIHQNVKKHVCEVCDRRFLLPQYLKEHRYIHTGEKPYKCSVAGCDRTFRQGGKLSTHLKQHRLAGELPQKDALKSNSYGENPVAQSFKRDAGLPFLSSKAYGLSDNMVRQALMERALMDPFLSAAGLNALSQAMHVPASAILSQSMPPSHLASSGFPFEHAMLHQVLGSQEPRSVSAYRDFYSRLSMGIDGRFGPSSSTHTRSSSSTLPSAFTCDNLAAKRTTSSSSSLSMSAASKLDLILASFELRRVATGFVWNYLFDALEQAGLGPSKTLFTKCMQLISDADILTTESEQLQQAVRTIAASYVMTPPDALTYWALPAFKEAVFRAVAEVTGRRLEIVQTDAHLSVTGFIKIESPRVAAVDVLFLVEWQTAGCVVYDRLLSSSPTAPTNRLGPFGMQ